MGARGVLGAGRDARYSGARRGYRGHQGLLQGQGDVGPFRGVRDIRGYRGVRGVLEASRDSSYSRAQRGIGGLREHWGLLGEVGM